MAPHPRPARSDYRAMLRHRQAKTWLDRYLPRNRVTPSLRYLTASAEERRKATELELAAVAAAYYEPDILTSLLDNSTHGWYPLMFLALSDVVRGGPRFVRVDRIPRLRTAASQTINTAADFERIKGTNAWTELGFQCLSDFMLVAQRIELVDSLHPDSVGRHICVDSKQRRYTTGVKAAILYMMRLRRRKATYSALAQDFDMSSTCASSTFRYVAISIVDKFGGMLHDENIVRYVSMAPLWNTAIKTLFMERSGLNYVSSIVEPAWAILDGVFQETTRPGKDFTDFQRYMYDGHEKRHGFHYYNVTAPNGIVIAMRGPWLGKNNDMSIISKGELDQHTSAIKDASGRRLKLLCDAIFPANHYLAPMSREAAAVNRPRRELKGEKACRAGVEHIFSILCNDYPYLYDLYKHRRNTLPQFHWKAATIIMNMRTALYGNTVSKRFKLQPFGLDRLCEGY